MESLRIEPSNREVHFWLNDHTPETSVTLTQIDEKGPLIYRVRTLLWNFALAFHMKFSSCSLILSDTAYLKTTIRHLAQRRRRQARFQCHRLHCIVRTCTIKARRRISEAWI